VCAACSRSVATGERFMRLAGRRDRREATRLVDEVLHGGGHPARVPGAGGVSAVPSGTGRNVVVDTPGQPRQTLLALPGPRPRTASVPDRAPRTHVSEALAAAARDAQAAIGATRRRSS
jgi:hypothetical protein